MLSRESASQSALGKTQPPDLHLRPPSKIKSDLISKLKEALQEIADLIADLDDYRDVDLANSRLSEWKRKTDRVINDSFEDGNLHFKMQLCDIIPDPNQRTPFNKIKNEARKCQKAIADILCEFV